MFVVESPVDVGAKVLPPLLSPPWWHAQGEEHATLGRGAHGCVSRERRCLVEGGGFTEVAVKRAVTTHQEKFLRAEAVMLKAVGVLHPGVVRLVQVSVCQQHQSLELVLELCGEDLFTTLNHSGGQYPPGERKRAFGGIVDALFHLHVQCNVAHGDIKCENIVCKLDACGQPIRDHLVLIDFAFARQGFSDAAPVRVAGKGQMNGSLSFVAPEMLHGMGYGDLFDFVQTADPANAWRPLEIGAYTLSDAPFSYDAYGADVWALGVVFFSMLTASFPWEVAHPACEKFLRTYSTPCAWASLCCTEEERNVLCATLAVDTSVRARVAALRFQVAYCCDFAW